MKCPQCQNKRTLKRAENNTVVCAVCGSRFSLNPPPKPSAPVPPPIETPTTCSVAPPPIDPVAQTPSKEKAPSLFSWNGRATQREFLGAVGYYLLCSLLLGVVLGVLFALLSSLNQAENDALRLVAKIGASALGLAGAAAVVVVTLVLLAASTRRFRAAGLSPYLTLLYFVVPAPLLIVFLALYEGKSNAETPKSRSQTPPPSKAPQINQTAQTPPTDASQADATPTAANATRGWRRFFSWNAPADAKDLPIALALYVGTAVWLTAHLFFDTVIDGAIGEYFYERHWFDAGALLGPVMLNFIRLVLLFGKLALLSLNLTALAVAGLTTVKLLRQ